LKKIPEYQKESFVLRRFLELSYEEIANYWIYQWAQLKLGFFGQKEP
jgi:N-acetylglutamate synthase-like GNAT family acetyltransferase